MSETVKAINNFFRNALKKDVDDLKINIVLSDRQLDIFDRFYIRKQSIGFIADTLNVCPQVINNELKVIRKKIIRLI